MDSSCNSKKPKNREPKQNQSSTPPPPQKNAYARLLSQHNSSKFSLYLKQHMQDTSQIEELMPSTLNKAQSDIQNVTLKKGDQLLINFSDSSDVSPSALKSKGDESSLSLYMQKLVTRNVQQDCERKQGVSDRQQRGQRRDTTTSYDGDVESGEELHLLKCNQTKKQQKKNKDSQETDTLFGPPQTPKNPSATGQEQKPTKSKKKTPRNPEEDTSRQGISGADTQMLRHGKGNKLQQTRGKPNIGCSMWPVLFLFLFWQLFLVKYFFSSKFSCSQEQRRRWKKEASVWVLLDTGGSFPWP